MTAPLKIEKQYQGRDGINTVIVSALACLLLKFTVAK
jgi:hypothetical protein